jgi:hypothetical protein
MFVCCVCGQVEVSATNWSLVNEGAIARAGLQMTQEIIIIIIIIIIITITITIMGWAKIQDLVCKL